MKSYDIIGWACTEECVEVYCPEHKCGHDPHPIFADSEECGVCGVCGNPIDAEITEVLNGPE